jgi:hypothetical protein
MAFKFGKLPYREDHRTIKFETVMRTISALPVEWSFQKKYPMYKVPTPMYGNNRYGDCVMAGRAHHTLRFEALEQFFVIPIQLKDVTQEYFAETGGPDSGLVVLDSLKLWRSKGWMVCGRNYKIAAFMSLNPQMQTALKTALVGGLAVGVGLDFPDTAMKQFHNNQPWDVQPGAQSLGGHYVACVGYNTVGPLYVSWGRFVQATWAFHQKYADEVWSITDAIDGKKGIDPRKLSAALMKIDQ